MNQPSKQHMQRIKIHDVPCFYSVLASRTLNPSKFVPPFPKTPRTRFWRYVRGGVGSLTPPPVTRIPSLRLASRLVPSRRFRSSQRSTSLFVPGSSPGIPLFGDELVLNNADSAYSWADSISTINRHPAVCRLVFVPWSWFTTPSLDDLHFEYPLGSSHMQDRMQLSSCPFTRTRSTLRYRLSPMLCS
jgi:hypothetical protein